MTSPQHESESSVLREAHLRDYWRVIWRGRWTILAVFVVVVGATAVWTFLQTPIYRATATVEIKPQAQSLAVGQDVSGLGAAGYGWFAEEKYHNTQVEIIKSRDVSVRVVDSLGLASHPDFEEIEDPARVLRRRILVAPRRETGLIEISIRGADRDEITRWTNEVAEQYVQRNLDKARENVLRAISAIQDQLQPLKLELDAAEERRLESLGSDDIFNPESQEALVRLRLETLNTERTDVQIRADRLRQTLSQIRHLREVDGDLLSLPELAEDQRLRDYYGTKIDLQRELESMKVELRPGHPDYEAMVGQLEAIEARIEETTSQILGKLQNQHDQLLRNELFLAERIRGEEEFSLKVLKSASQGQFAKGDAENRKVIFGLINKAMEEISLGMQLMTNNVSILDPALPPLVPIKPRKRLNLMIGAFFGMFLGISLVFFVDYLDNTFRTPEDIEKYLSLAVLGVIPKMAEGEEALSNRAIKEAYQSLRTSVIFSSKNRERKVVLITSTNPQEGKSSTVTNLGRMLAMSGDRVIVLDCDLRRPTQHLQLASEREHGLTNYLAAPAERADWTVYIKTVGPSNLHVMTCGPIPPSPPELLSSERFGQLLVTLRETYDWVLIDSPPAATLADTTILAAMADMTVLVVRHNHTDRDLVSKTLQRLRAVNPAIAGAVLNNVDLERAYNKDYYYAGYYYYGDDDKRSKKNRRQSKAPVS